jgi:hypothetical protein
MAACKNADEKAKEDLLGSWKYIKDSTTIQYTFTGDNYAKSGTAGAETGTFTVSGGTITLKASGGTETKLKFDFSEEKKKLTLKNEDGSNSITFTKV